MVYWIEKGFLLLLCIILFQTPIDVPFIVALLAIIICNCICYITDNSLLRILIYLIYFAGSVYLPDFLYIFLPVLCYNLAAEKKWLLFVYVIPVLNMLLTDYFDFVAICLLSGFAYFLHWRELHTDELEHRIKVLRDADTELQLLLTQQNHDLVISKNNEIQMATLQERNRIAREIHDNVGHLLTRSILQTGALIAINKNEALAAPLMGLRDTLDTAMNNIRTSVHDLHDETVNLQTAIQDMLDHTPNIAITFRYEMKDDLPKEIKYHMIAIFKEALNNITKHSNADKVTISCFEHPGFYQFMIADNGTNIQSLINGMGLTNMKNRIDACNGSMRIDTKNGFQIFIVIMKGD